MKIIHLRRQMPQYNLCEIKLNPLLQVDADVTRTHTLACANGLCMFIFVANRNQSRNIWLNVVANANIFFQYFCWTDLKSPVGCLANRRWYTHTHTQYCNNDRPSKAINMSCHKLQCKRECKSIYYVLSAAAAATAAAKCMFDRMKMLCYYSAKCLCSFDAFILLRTYSKFNLTAQDACKHQRGKKCVQTNNSAI